MSLNDMPDDVLIRLLNSASPTDVTRAKRLNKRFNQLVDTYNLGKPRVTEFCVESRISSVLPSDIGRLRMDYSSTNPRRHTVITMKRGKGMKQMERIEDPCSSTAAHFVQETFRKIDLHEKLLLDGMVLDEAFYNILINKKDGLKHVTKIALSMCQIQLTPNQFADFLSRTALKHLFIDFCIFDPAIFTDKLLMSLPDLETFHIQPRYAYLLNELTDQTLINWATSSSFPKTIQIRNGCSTRVTVEGIKLMIMRGLTTPSNPQSPIDWNFGLVLGPTQSDSSLLALILCPGLSTKINDDFRSRRINLNRENLALQFFIPAPFPVEPISAAVPA